MARKKQNNELEDIDKQIEKLKKEVRNLEAKKTEIEDAEYIKEHGIKVSNYTNKFILDTDHDILYYVKKVKIQANGILITSGTEYYIDSDTIEYDRAYKVPSDTFIYYESIKVYTKEDAIKHIEDVKKARIKSLDKMIDAINKIQ